MRSGGGHTAAADLVYLYAATQQWFVAERRYKAFDSEPVRLNHADLFLDRTGTGKRQSQLKAEFDGDALDDGIGISGIQAAALRAEADSPGSGDELDSSGVAGLRGTTARTEKLQQSAAPLQAPQPAGPAVRKKYSQQYIWGQLNGWFKQTVYDPAATLSAERRGTLSLPDIESAYSGAAARYDIQVPGHSFRHLSTALNISDQLNPHGSLCVTLWFAPASNALEIICLQERDELLTQLESKPDAMWKSGTFWSFRNEAKVYGSPMFDSAWADCNSLAADPLPQVISQLRAAPVPSVPASPREPAGNPLDSTPSPAQQDGRLQPMTDSAADAHTQAVPSSTLDTMTGL